MNKPCSIDIDKLEVSYNVCEQTLREVCKSDELSIAHVFVAKGSASLPHHHKKFTETYYFIRGKGYLEVNGKRVEIKPRLTVVLPPGTSHKLVNNGQTKIEHLVLSTPAFIPDDVILEKDAN